MFGLQKRRDPPGMNRAGLKGVMRGLCVLWKMGYLSKRMTTRIRMRMD